MEEISNEEFERLFKELADMTEPYTRKMGLYIIAASTTADGEIKKTGIVSNLVGNSALILLGEQFKKEVLMQSDIMKQERPDKEMLN